jgi:hypothetical protein
MLAAGTTLMSARISIGTPRPAREGSCCLRFGLSQAMKFVEPSNLSDPAVAREPEEIANAVGGSRTAVSMSS